MLWARYEPALQSFLIAWSNGHVDVLHAVREELQLVIPAGAGVRTTLISPILAWSPVRRDALGPTADSTVTPKSQSTTPPSASIHVTDHHGHISRVLLLSDDKGPIWLEIGHLHKPEKMRAAEDGAPIGPFMLWLGLDNSEIEIWSVLPRTGAWAAQHFLQIRIYHQSLADANFGAVAFLQHLPKLRLIITGFSKGNLIVWDTTTLLPTHHRAFREEIGAFCMLGNTLLIGTEQGLLRQFQIRRSTALPLSSGQHASHAAVRVEPIQELRTISTGNYEPITRLLPSQTQARA
jgi:hypothetical protein